MTRTHAARHPYKAAIVRVLLGRGFHDHNMIALARLLTWLRKQGLARRQSAYSALRDLDQLGFLAFRKYPDGCTFVGFSRAFPALDSMARLYLHIQQAPLTGHMNSCKTSIPNTEPPNSQSGRIDGRSMRAKVLPGVRGNPKLCDLQVAREKVTGDQGTRQAEAPSLPP
jgi:hypothetical protein